MVILSCNCKHSSKSQRKQGNATIKKADFGIIPDMPFLLGLILTFELPLGLEATNYFCVTSAEDDDLGCIKACSELKAFLRDAGAHNVSELIGKRVKLFYENDTLKGFYSIPEK